MRSTLCVAAILACYISTMRSDLQVLTHCHYDPDPPPQDGVLPRDQFPWMAVLEYLHLETALRYPSRVPRVSLVHQRFGLTTASAAAGVPEGYALGNIVIVEYVRDEASCGLSMEDVIESVQCPRSSYVIPVSDVILHPEYSSFGAPESVALLKLMRPVDSLYLMPICLPNGAVWTYDMIVEKVYLLDFLSPTPEDYENENKALKRLHILNPDNCDNFQETLNISSTWWPRTLCTSGCGMRAGAPLVAHDRRLRIGYYWQLVGMAVGGPLCQEPAARHRRNNAPPRFVYVWPYVDWIVQVMTSHEIPFPLPIALLRSDERLPILKKWSGRWYEEGKICHEIPRMQMYPLLFYEDYFSLRTVQKSILTLELTLTHDINYSIVCVKVQMPNTFSLPNVYFDPLNLTIEIPLTKFPRRYDLRVQAFCVRALPEDVKNRTAVLKARQDAMNG